MSYITPNGIVKLCQGIHLDNTYQHTGYFANATAQRAKIESYVVKTFTNVNYQRVNKNTIRVQANYEEIYQCNYMMFNNQRTPNKWYYAFINAINYINEQTSELEYEIDVMQTWLFDVDVGMCFVEREHSATDNMGDNTIDEGLETNLLYNNPTDIMNEDCTPSRALVFMKQKYKISPTAGGYKYELDPDQRRSYIYVNGICNVSGINQVFDLTNDRPWATDNTNGLQGLSKFLSEVNGDDVIAIFMTPNVTNHSSALYSYSQSVETINGYIPKNKKLHCYPFNRLTLTNNNGQINEYRIERFKKNNTSSQYEVQFYLAEADRNTSPSVMIYPKNYQGIEDNYDEGIALGNFPIIMWYTDVYQSWIVQNRNRAVWGNIASALGYSGTAYSMGNNIESNGLTAGNISTGVGMVGSLLGGVVSTIAKIDDLKNTPPNVSGLTNFDELSAVLGKFKFTLRRMSVTPEYAEQIDNFFTMFGYACHKVKVPNIWLSTGRRPCFNYVKTRGAIIHARETQGGDLLGLPSDDEKKIGQIYDNGITFWSNLSNVGDYSQNNSPT